MPSFISSTPKPPYFAVIFTSIKRLDAEGYSEMAEKMEALAARQKGYLGIESIRDTEGRGITVSYWQTEEDIKQWKRNEEHLVAQEQGRTNWYEHYNVRVCKVERVYGDLNKAF